MVEITEEMRNMKNSRMREVENRVDESIKQALLDGRNYCHFPCDKDRDSDVYDEICAKYKKAGYKIKPTGYIGGVLQTTQRIYW